jgi:predicted Rossmann-fold nucleotide-binding protein
MEHSVQECFMGRNHLKMWSVIDEPEQVLEAFANSHSWDADALEYANVTAANA